VAAAATVNSEHHERESVIIPDHLVLKNSFGFGGTNVSLVFGDVVDVAE
jgi:3-oxoacyl-(acyl-carrier-protein) synthase